MFLSAIFVLCCISMIDTNQCDISKEKSTIARMLQSVEKKIKASGECTGPENCPAGWKKYKTHCYFFSPDSKHWQDAAKQCQNMGGYLVKITDSAENSWVVYMLKKSVKHIIGSWMGLTDLKKEGDLRWVVDSSAVSYSHWYRGEPSYSKNEDCVHFWAQADYKWNDAPCHMDNIGYICECSHAYCRPFTG